MFLKKYIRQLAQLRLAILLLLAIAGISIIGTIIEQNQSNEYYVEQYSQILFDSNFKLGDIILRLGLDHVYSTYTFSTLIVLFGSCLLSCTLTQQFPLLAKSRSYLFQIKKNQFLKNQLNAKTESIQYLKFLNRIKSKNYTIFQQKKTIYAYRGILGRFAPIVVHGSLIIILIGTLVAALTNFQSQELIPKGEVVQIHNIVSQNRLSNINLQPIRVNDFWIEYGVKENIKQFYSDISILDSTGIEKKRKTISVNYPLRYQGLTIYQTDWSVAGLRINEGGKVKQIPVITPSKNKATWISWLPTSLSNQNGDAGEIVIFNKVNGKFSLFAANGKLLGNYRINEEVKINNSTNLKLIEIIPTTGLQIKADPSIPLLYFGFAILMLSTLISYVSYNQFWGLKETDTTALIAGSSNRSKLNLEREFHFLEKNTKSFV